MSPEDASDKKLATYTHRLRADGSSALAFSEGLPSSGTSVGWLAKQAEAWHMARGLCMSVARMVRNRTCDAPSAVASTAMHWAAACLAAWDSDLAALTMSSISLGALAPLTPGGDQGCEEELQGLQRCSLHYWHCSFMPAKSIASAIPVDNHSGCDHAVKPIASIPITERSKSAPPPSSMPGAADLKFGFNFDRGLNSVGVETWL